MSHTLPIREAFCSAVNAVKRNALTVQTLDTNHYLGGDLGIDSIEMLEIWFRIEKCCGTHIPDADKRDIYTVEEVLNVVYRHLPAVNKEELAHV